MLGVVSEKLGFCMHGFLVIIVDCMWELNGCIDGREWNGMNGRDWRLECGI